MRGPTWSALLSSNTAVYALKRSGRTDRQMVMQILALLAASPAPAPQEPAALRSLVLRLCESAIDSDAAGRPDGALYRLAAEVKRRLASPAPGELGAVDASAGWISVEDRMPEPDSGEVLVWLSGGRCAFDEWHMHREDPTGMSTTYTMEMGLMWRDYEFEDITHWIPLPQPPQQAPSSAQGSGGEKV